MAVSKKYEFAQDEIQFADICKALSHPARIAILKFLARQTSCICGEIVEALPLSQSTVSQHLKELKRVGVISGEVEGPKICYCLNHIELKKVKENFATFLNQLNCC